MRQTTHLARLALAALIIPCWLTARGAELPLDRAEAIALDHDSGYSALITQSQAMVDQATADSQLPDPVFSVGWLNLPVEDFNLGQEPMNQVRIGIKQVFPAGETLSIKKSGDLAAADGRRQQAVSRQLSTLLETRTAWLEVQYAERALFVIQQNERLFQQLRKITGTLYRNGKKDLSDVVRAELELQRLKDREIASDESIARHRTKLARWVGEAESEAPLPAKQPDWQFDPHHESGMAGSLLNHPLVRAMDARIEQLRDHVDLAKQQYKPSWSVELGYAFRNAHRANGTEVSNLASIGASINLPIFTRHRQDKRVSAASTQLSAALDSRRDLVKKLTSRLEADLIRIEKLNDRIALHRNLIIPQAKEQASAALMAYQANRADFAEVMRARIAELNSILEESRLQTERLEAIAAAWYLLPPQRDLQRTAVRQPVSGVHHEQ